jgi:hypothetical protein
MKTITRAALGAAALALCLASTSAPAAGAKCWTQAEVAAAKVREMQTRLMVAALRCRAFGMNILTSYNDFIAAGRGEIVAANDRLKAHFMADGAAAGQRDYDRYTTALANAYGAAETGPESCAEATTLAADAVAAKGKLIALAAREIPVATLPSAMCSASESMVLAAK